MSRTTYRTMSVIAAFIIAATTVVAQSPMTVTNDGLAFPDGSVQNTAAAGHRLYYLSDTNYTSDQAVTACATGYHLASMWEILDPSNLIYAFDHPDAHIKTDSGSGPPSLWYGRVHTGADSSTSDSAGTANCANWTSVSASDFGSFVRLKRGWEDPSSLEFGAIWDAESFACSLIGPVWCIEDRVPNAADGPQFQARGVRDEPPNSVNAPPTD